jgi:hypothetical protein
VAKYTREVLTAVAAQSRSIAEMLRRLGIRQSGGAHAHISRRLKAFGIDTSHFTGQAHNRGKSSQNRLGPKELLVLLPPGSRRTPGRRLTRALLEIGLPERCDICGVSAVWQAAPLTLHVDHINGDFLDNRLHNIRLVCPNCHSQTPTYAGCRRVAPDQAEVVCDGATTMTGIPFGPPSEHPPEWSGRAGSDASKGP